MRGSHEQACRWVDGGGVGGGVGMAGNNFVACCWLSPSKAYFRSWNRIRNLLIYSGSCRDFRKHACCQQKLENKLLIEIRLQAFESRELQLHSRPGKPQARKSPFVQQTFGARVLIHFGYGSFGSREVGGRTRVALRSGQMRAPLT